MSSSTKTKTTSVEGPSSTTKTTTTTFRSGQSTQSTIPSYRPVSSRRTTVIQRSTGGPSHRGGGMIERSVNYGYNSMPQVSASAYSNVASLGVAAVTEGRQQEKKDMQDLNERLGSYIEKVRFLEAQNRKLADELDKLKSKWGKETSAVKAMYEIELDQLRKIADDAERDKSELAIKLASMEEQFDEVVARVENLAGENFSHIENIEKQNQTLSDYEGEINLLRRRNEGLEQESTRSKLEIKRLNDLVNKLRGDLDIETLNHIEQCGKAQSLEEHMEFLKGVHDQEMKELAALAYKDTTSENREFWKNEMGSCLREIQQMYDEKLVTMRGELEGFYNMKLNEFRTGATRQNMETVNAKEETKKLRSLINDLRSKNGDLEGDLARLTSQLETERKRFEDEIRELSMENDNLKSELVKMRAELEALLQEMQDIMDTKLGLELEIAAYRKLLEGEESRVGLKSVVDSMLTSGFSAPPKKDDDGALKASQLIRGQMSAKTTYQRSAKGTVSIKDCAANGAFVVIENSGRKEEQLGGWKIKRIVDDEEKVNLALDKNFSLRPGTSVKLYTNAVTNEQKRELTGSDVFVQSIDTFEIGSNIRTLLCNDRDQEKASHTQMTTYK